MRAARAALAVVLLAGSAACASEPGDAAPVPSPFQDCAALTGATTPADLPDLSLPCFTGGSPVRLTGVSGPAVINIWGSYCGPCRAELPVMQRLADRGAGRVTVIGLDTGDDRGAAASFAAERGVTMPTLFDPDRRILAELGQTALPVTVFIDARGRRTVHRLPLDAAGLSRELRERTGVRVAL